MATQIQPNRRRATWVHLVRIALFGLILAMIHVQQRQLRMRAGSASPSVLPLAVAQHVFPEAIQLSDDRRRTRSPCGA